MRLPISAISLAVGLLASGPALADSVAVTAGGGHTSVTTDGKPCRVVSGHNGNSMTVISGNGAVSGSTTVSPGGSGSSVTVGSGSSGGSHASSSAGSDCVVTKPKK